MAAHESSDHAAEHELRGLGDTTFEQLYADVKRLSRLMDVGSPLPTFLELRRVRDRIHMLRAKLADVAYYRGQYNEARDLAAESLRYASDGSPGAELHIWHARASARLGDADTARRSVTLADAARDIDYTDDLLEIGGGFAVSRATHHTLAGRALVDVSGADRDAAAELEQAISLYDAGPSPDEEFWFAGQPLAGVNLALVRLRSGAMDAAEAALEPALSLPAEQRISDITGPLADVRRELAAPIFQGSPQARALGDQIETFTREAVTTAFHSLTG